jgi:hypothetical protein
MLILKIKTYGYLSDKMHFKKVIQKHAKVVL